MSDAEIIKSIQNDRIRLKRVGKIFGEGCFINAKDYMNAALIYQHGNTPDHFYQAFIWSKRGAELGALNGQSFSALAMDRYLISIGKKQLFGSQFQKLSANRCFCMQPVEPSFSDIFRKKYSGRSLKDNYNILSSLNDATCPKIECKTSLQPTPRGSVYRKMLG